MDKTRKIVIFIFVAFVILLIMGGLAATAHFALAGLLTVLYVIGKVLAMMVICLIAGTFLNALASVAAYAIGIENTVFERLILEPRKERGKQWSSSKPNGWAETADATIATIGKKLKKLKPGDSKTLDTLVTHCESGLIKLNHFIVRGDSVLEKSKKFMVTHEARKTQLETLHDSIVEELRGLEVQPEDLIRCSMRSMKTQELVVVQDKLKELKSQKKHYEYLSGTVNATRLLVTQAIGHVKHTISELHRKKERESILGV